MSEATDIEIKAATNANNDLGDFIVEGKHVLSDPIKGANALTAYEAQQESRIDLLTHLPNERALDDFLTGIENAWERSKKNNSLPLIHGTVVAMDLTGLHKVNEEHGHAVGDAYLRAVADALRDASREEDHIFRFGKASDEFVVFLPNLIMDKDIETYTNRIDSKLREKQQKAAELYPGIEFSLSTVSVKYNNRLNPNEAYGISMFQLKEAKKHKEKETGTRGLSVGNKII